MLGLRGLETPLTKEATALTTRKMMIMDFLGTSAPTMMISIVTTQTDYKNTFNKGPVKTLIPSAWYCMVHICQKLEIELEIYEVRKKVGDN